VDQSTAITHLFRGLLFICDVFSPDTRDLFPLLPGDVSQPLQLVLRDAFLLFFYPLLELIFVRIWTNKLRMKKGTEVEWFCRNRDETFCGHVSFAVIVSNAKSKDNHRVT